MILYGIFSSGKKWMRNFSIIVVSLWIAFIAFWGIRNTSAPLSMTVSGPEAAHLISQSQGYLIHAVNAQAGIPPSIKIISLPNAKEKMLTTPVSTRGYYHIDQITGPDEEGRIFYTITKENQKKYDILMTTLDGKKHDVIFSEDFSKERNRLSGLDYGHTLILSPKGGHIAFIKDTDHYDRKGGILELWNINDKSLVTRFSASGYSSASWFPDGLRLAYVKRVDCNKIPEFSVYSESVQKLYADHYRYTWPLIDAAFIYDLSTQTHEFFHIGYRPVVSFDGSAILLNDILGKCRLIDVQNKTATEVNWPGRIHTQSAFAFSGENEILYRGFPTKGRATKTIVDSPFWGRKLMPPIKIADLLTGEFQTVIESLHPYDDISYGIPKDDILTGVE